MRIGNQEKFSYGQSVPFERVTNHAQWRWLVLAVAMTLLLLAWSLTSTAAMAQEANEVSVSLADGVIEMPASVPAGPTRFVVTNNGQFDHNFEIEGQGIEAFFDTDLAPGESQTMEIDLPPGDYRVYCPVDDHAERGMELVLTVTAAETAPGSEEQTAPPQSTVPGSPAIALVLVADGLADPVNVAAPADGSGRIFVVERIGRIRIVQDGQLLDEPFLDIQDLVKTDFLEQGLLGLAFHPGFAENGRFFVYYSDYLTNGDVFLVEYAVSGDPNVADSDSARVLLTHDQPYVNHNGGTIRFGPDGYLYVALGDGGLAGDPYRNAQDTSMLLGKLLRIDVDVDEGSGRPYRIPSDNPFQGQVLSSSSVRNLAQSGAYLPDARPEIWAYGLRNPWQFSFDALTGDLYITDVGQNMWEEINIEPAGTGGGLNYGWPILEGSHCFPEEATCQPLGVLPIAEYSHEDGSCSITGIGVYRGVASPGLDGIYFYSDYCSGKIRGLVPDASGAAQQAEFLDTELQVSGAGADEAGELYLTACTCEFDRRYDPLDNPGGTVWRIVAADQVPSGATTAPPDTGEEEAPEPPAEATATPTIAATATVTATVAATETPTLVATAVPTVEVTITPTVEATATPTVEITATPTVEATMTPTVEVTVAPTVEVTITPTVEVTPTATPEPAVGESQIVDVLLVDGEIQMPTTLAAGLVTFNISNAGQFEHSFEIEGQGIEAELENDLQPGQSGSLTLQLAAGEYYVYCPVGNHEERGMNLTVTVQ